MLHLAVLKLISHLLYLTTCTVHTNQMVSVHTIIPDVMIPSKSL